jgi:predicted acetyltransferase
VSDYGPPSGERELSAIAAIVAQCFNTPAEDVGPWLARAGQRNLRVRRHGGQVCACLLIIPMGQWFGGRSVPMGGIAAVGVPAEHRGAGHALAITRAAVAEMAGDGLLLSTLYPATTHLYRQAGYEVAGGRFELRLQPQLIGLRERELPLRPAVADDLPAIRQLAARRAALGQGALDRGEYIWSRIREPRAKPARGYVVERDGRLEGYAYLQQVFGAGRPGHYDVVATDCAALTPQAGRRLLTLFADHGSLADSVTLHGGPADPLLALLPDRSWTARLVDPWMIRVLDVKGALEARGWPAAARGELLLDVRDELLPRNRGRFLLEVEGGRARVGAAPAALQASHAQPPALQLDVRGLSPLYSSYMAPGELLAAGLLAGPPEALDVAASLFAGPAPVMSDMF